MATETTLLKPGGLKFEGNFGNHFICSNPNCPWFIFLDSVVFRGCLALNLKISSFGSFLRFTSITLRILEALYRKAEEGLNFLSSSELTSELVASDTSIEVSENV